MSNIINWIRSNLVITISLVVMAICLAAFYWPITVQGAAFVAEMQKQGNAVPSRIKSLMQTPVEIPPRDINISDVETKNMPVSMAVVEKLKTIYTQRESQFGSLFREVDQLNHKGHEVMLDGLFPRESSEAKLYNAKERYRQSLDALYQALSAGMPPSDDQLTALTTKEEEKFRTRFIVEDKLSSEQETALAKETASAYLLAFQQAASQINLYADRASCFQIGDWVISTERPDIFDVWEGQMRLWIQQDLTAALADANASDETGVSAKPIKRLLNMSVVGGYIGVDDQRSGAPSEKVIDITQPVANAFELNPTGRKSNAYYDVRLAKLSVIVDSRAIPRLLNAIGKFNLMTVVASQISDVDEYEHLKRGYWYGRVDAVQLDLVIETLWLRSWTAGHNTQEEAQQIGQPFNPGLMPDAARHHLGLKPRSDGFKPSERSRGVFTGHQDLFVKYGAAHRR